jgi:hypothetical protein
MPGRPVRYRSRHREWGTWSTPSTVVTGHWGLMARPVCHRKRDSVEAHLATVFAALAVSRWIEARTGWSIRRFVRTARRYRTIQVQAGLHVITAADHLPADLHQALDTINLHG